MVRIDVRIFVVQGRLAGGFVTLAIHPIDFVQLVGLQHIKKKKKKSILLNILLVVICF